MNYPKISVIIPLIPSGSADIALNSLKTADYPQELIETLVIEGTNPSSQRNAGIKKSTGDILFFLDDDSEIAPDLFKNALAAYQSYPRASAVGGPAVLYGKTHLQEAIKLILTTYLGVYTIRARYKPVGQTRYTDENELISCNLSLKRQVFETEPGFNEKLYPNEENELINSLIKKGYKFIYDPGCIVLRQVDSDIEKFLKRIFNYGRGRMEQLFLSPSQVSFYRLLPFVFLIYIVVLLCVPNPYLYLPFLLYLSAIIINSCYCCRHKIKIIPLVIALYLATHIFYALGLVWGIYPALKLKRNAQDD